MARDGFAHLVDARGRCAVSTPLLVVEDDPHLRCMMVLLLEGEGLPVAAAVDGLDALRWLQDSRPCLVLLDLNLPYLNGDEVGARIRARYGQDVPIILVTANQGGAEIAAALKATYLPKPFDVDTLLTVVWQCLEQACVIGDHQNNREGERPDGFSIRG